MGAQCGDDELAAAEKIRRHRPTSSLVPTWSFETMPRPDGSVLLTGMLGGGAPYNPQPLSAMWNRSPGRRARRASKKLL